LYERCGVIARRPGHVAVHWHDADTGRGVLGLILEEVVARHPRPLHAVVLVAVDARLAGLVELDLERAAVLAVGPVLLLGHRHFATTLVVQADDHVAALGLQAPHLGDDDGVALVGR
jgi:hypothetical protein